MKIIITTCMLIVTSAVVVSSNKTELTDETLIFPPLPVAVLTSKNNVCQQHSAIYIQNLKNLTLWAYEMWDATAKSPTGMLMGNVFQMGNFDECLGAEAPFPTQYCMATIKAHVPEPQIHKDPFSLRHDPFEPVWEKVYPFPDKLQQPRNALKVGWCIPASCSRQDLQEFLNEYVKEIDLPLQKTINVTYTAEFTDKLCFNNEEKLVITPGDIAFVLVTLGLAGLVALASLWDFKKMRDNEEMVLKTNQENIVERLLGSFSAFRTVKEFLRVDADTPQLALLHGMKAFCIIVVTTNHRIAVFASAALQNKNFVESHYRWPKYPIFSFVFHGELFIDSFFVLSGILATYQLMKYMENKENPFVVFLNRYVRLTPVYAYVVFYYATMLDHMGNGPEWKEIVTYQSEDCRKNWWANILYISNYHDDENMCLALSWFLPCMFHAYIIGIVVCYVMSKNRKFGLGSLLLVTLIAILLPFVITIMYSKPGLMFIWPEFMTRPQATPDFRFMYTKTHMRSIPFFVGMVGGYFYYKLKGKDIKVGWVMTYFGLVVSMLLVLVPILTSAVFYNPYYKYNAVESATYSSLHKVGFSIGTAWFVYLTSYGKLGWLRRFLSWWPCVMGSKLTYGVYLVHMSYQYIDIGSYMSPGYFSYYNIVITAISDVVLSFVFSFLMYFAIEEPCRVIFRTIRKAVNGTLDDEEDNVPANTTGHTNNAFDGNENLSYRIPKIGSNYKNGGSNSRL